MASTLPISSNAASTPAAASLRSCSFLSSSALFASMTWKLDPAPTAATSACAARGDGEGTFAYLEAGDDFGSGTGPNAPPPRPARHPTSRRRSRVRSFNRASTDAPCTRLPARRIPLDGADQPGPGHPPHSSASGWRRVEPVAVLKVYADVWCPFAHVGLRSVVRRRYQLGRDDVVMRVRA